MNIPQPPDVLTGTDWTIKLARVEDAAREAILLAAYLQGYVPNFLRTPVEVRTLTGAIGGTFLVTRDYLCLGTDEDFLRTPMWPTTAQKIADAWKCSLPTRRIVNATWDQASIRLQPLPMPPNDPQRPMTSTRMFIEHNTRIRLQLVEHGAPGPLVAGQKKDIVVSPKLQFGHVGIFGWHQLSGVPIQGLNLISHASNYCDYSHGVRLVDLAVELEGSTSGFVQYGEVLKDAVLSKLASDEGPSLVWRQPGV